MSQLSFSEQWLYRNGCGYGIHQAHMVGVIKGQVPSIKSLGAYVDQIQGLLYESLDPLPCDSSLHGFAKWLVNSTGVLLRHVHIATVRDSYVRSLLPLPDGMAQCLFALPVASVKPSMLVLEWLLGLVNNPPAIDSELDARFSQLQTALKPYKSASVNHWRTLQAAHDERHPVLAVTPGVVCIGSGSKRRWFRSFITDQTSLLGMQIAKNKHQTAQLLRDNGYPGASNLLVNTQQQVREAVRKLGYPVVVKPNDQDRGEGVTANLVNEEDVCAAFDLARQLSKQVLVEKFQPGSTHRLTVICGRVIRAARHNAFGVIGDAHNSIEKLIELRRSSPEGRKRAQQQGREFYVLDDEAMGLLRQNGLTPGYIPDAGEYVRLRRKDNISAGGERVTLELDQVHPDNIRLAQQVSELLGLDFAGVDLITPDIASSWRDVPATICEINGNPQLVARDDPEMYKRVLSLVLPNPSRIPVTLVVTAQAIDEAMRTRLIAHFSAHSGSGLSCAEGIWIAGDFHAGPFAHGHEAAHALAICPKVHRATFVLTIHEVLRHGLVLGQIDVLVVPWGVRSEVPESLRQVFEQMMSLVSPHVLKIAKGKDLV